MRTPYALNKFCAFRAISIEFYNSAEEMQGRVANITELFSPCVKKKATLGEVQLKRSRPRRAKKNSVSIEFRSTKFAYLSLR